MVAAASRRKSKAGSSPAITASYVASSGPPSYDASTASPAAIASKPSRQQLVEHALRADGHHPTNLGQMRAQVVDGGGGRGDDLVDLGGIPISTRRGTYIERVAIELFVAKRTRRPALRSAATSSRRRGPAAGRDR